MMSDRTSVVLKVLTTQVKETTKIFEFRPPDDVDSYDEFTYLHFQEVNNGELDLLSELQNAGIAYTSEWERGYDFCSGEETARFSSDGKLEIITVYDDSKSPEISYLKELLDGPDPLNKLRDCINKHIEAITHLPWDNQEAYGKLYRTTKLITM